MIQTPGAKGSKKVTNPFSACHPLVFGRLRTMESPDSINGWDRSIAFARSAVTVREAAAMSAVCKEKRWLTLIRLNRCIVVVTKPALWHSKFELIWLQSVIRWLLSAKKGIRVIVFDLFTLVTLDMFLSRLDTNQPMYAGWYFEFNESWSF